jgi:putative Holliday junction resolvase
MRFVWPARPWARHLADNTGRTGVGRVLGLDLGSKRIGIAVSDRSGLIASPLSVLQRSGSERRDHEAIAKLVVEEECERIVVGLPLSLDGSVGRAAKSAIAEVGRLATVVSVPVSAERALMEAKMRADARRRVVDKVAAAVMLQSWIDRQANL